MPLYRLKKGTHSTGNLLDGTLKVYKSSDPQNNVIDHPDELLASKEPDRYERVDGPSMYTTRGGEEYHAPQNPEDVDKEIERLQKLAAEMRQSQKSQIQQAMQARKEQEQPEGPGVLKQGEDRGQEPPVPTRRDQRR